MSARRSAAGLLFAGLLLAVGTPAYVAHAAPHLAVYLINPAILLVQAAPYVVCAVIWLPWRTPVARTPSLILAALLFVAALVVYLPILWTPAKNGGDMIGLAYILISVVTTAGVLLGSATAGLMLWLRGRAQRASISG
jgi:hypothetical protein